MAFLINQSVISIKLTDKGRELLSRGQLRFTKYGIGDSEIDYAFNNDSGFDGLNATILRPRDNNPEIISFIPKVSGGDNLTPLSSVVTNTSIISNTTDPRGFFDVSGNIYENDIYIKQPNLQIAISAVAGGTTLTVNKSPTWGSFQNLENVETIGDYLLIAWANPLVGSTVSFAVDKSIPYLWYKIEDIISGSIATDDLVVTVDRELPDFGGLGGSIQAGAYLLPNSNDRETEGTSIDNYYGAPYVTDFVSESVLAFQDNFDTPTIDVPVWNLSIVFAEEIAGIGVNDRHYGQYWSKAYAGFVSYIQEQDPTYEKLGLIHYTNNSPSNIYGEGFFEDTPVITIPTVLWYKKTSGTIGITLTADATSKTTLPDLNTIYYDLIDEDDNVVGKVFNDLKLFVIEDQELLMAMSYKSNRNWTLPAIQADFNASLCPDSDLIIVSATPI